jgi:IclR family acetate operon transcriptional repressor
MARAGMPAQTSHPLPDPDELVTALHRIRRDGYAVDEQEQEVGVRCVAVPIDGVSSRMAVSVSGPAGRMTPELVERAIPLLTEASTLLSAELAERPSA